MLDAPLTEVELDRLDEFLEGCKGGQAMSLEELDGFFTALVAGPEIVMPSEYLPLVLGGEMSQTCDFETIEEANEVLALMMRHWNTIATTFNNDEMHVPVLFEDDEGTIGCNEWSHGFMRGVSMRYDAWSELMDDTGPGYLFPMMFFDHEHDPDPELRPPPLAPEKREELIALMASSPLLIYRHFKQRQQSRGDIRPPAQRRAQAKTGRNQPCPCGSGKKYKHCHGRVTG